jgi:hypothetical protein
VRLNVFSEQDHRNQPLQQQLSEEEREVLRLAGDDPLRTVSGVDSTGFASDQVLYRRTDSLGYDPVYVFSSIPEEAVPDHLLTESTQATAITCNRSSPPMAGCSAGCRPTR